MMLARFCCWAAMMAGGGIALRAGWGQAPLNTSGSGQNRVAESLSKAASDIGAEQSKANEGRSQYWFGVAVENIPPAISKQLKLQPQQGLMIVASLPDSPAAKAGLAADDLLIELNGEPIISQQQLARAANAPTELKVSTGKPSALAAASDFVFLRNGDRQSVQIMPVVRPANMLVTGPRLDNFIFGSAHADGDLKAAAANAVNVPDMKNYVIPNGNMVMIGPGYQFDLQGQGSSISVMRQAVGNGPPVVLSQETDAAGHVTSIISQGANSYTVTAGHLDAMPENMRGLAQQMLDNSAKAGTQNNFVTPTDNLETMNKKLADDETRIKSLEAEVERLSKLAPPPQKADGK